MLIDLLQARIMFSARRTCQDPTLAFDCSRKVTQVSSSPRPPLYSIAAVSKLTGISCHALRVWERRYGFPSPMRTASGQRRYPAAEVESLRLVAAGTKVGRMIGEVIAELQAGELRVEGQEIGCRDEPTDSDVVELLFDHFRAGKADAAISLLDDWQSRLDAPRFITRIVEPTMVEVGERWFRKEIDIHHERLASSLLLRRIDSMLDRAKRANPSPKRRALICAIQGDRHEGGVRSLALALELAGWRAESLGVDLPVRELAKAVETWQPDAVGVSFVLSRNINKRFNELKKIEQVPVFVGGRSLTNYQGLAKRSGLIPLAVPVFEILPYWEAECRRWFER